MLRVVACLFILLGEIAASSPSFSISYTFDEFTERRGNTKRHLGPEKDGKKASVKTNSKPAKVAESLEVPSYGLGTYIFAAAFTSLYCYLSAKVNSPPVR